MVDGDTGSRRIAAIKVHQWLPGWDEVSFDESAHRRRPDPHFYVFSLSAAHLKALTGIKRRTTEGGRLRTEDPNIQRRHEKARSEEIERFVGHGYPWSTLGRAKRESGQFDDLRKPGWLPTAIIVNILRRGDGRADDRVDQDDFIEVEDEGAAARVRLPESFSGARWEPKDWHPIEVIDGQHRLWAFEEDPSGGEFELPVVAYHGLDVSWQAYLFWTINIKPKRINSSLAFDLYPLLRTEDWLERAEGLAVYRETRAQELTESLWAHPASPWHHRINMLGESGLREAMVSQAAWIRALTATYVRPWESRASIGGLYGAPVGGQQGVLPWSRAQQAAFLIAAGRRMRDAVAEADLPWTKALRRRDTQEVQLFEEEEGSAEEKDAAFYGSQTLLNQDQGIRGLLYATNHLCYVTAADLGLGDWVTNEDAGAADEQAVSDALASLEQHPSYEFLGEVARGLAGYDWRTSAAPGLSDDQRTLKAAFRGAGGYRELRVQLFGHLARQPGAVGEAATNVLERIG